VENAPPARNEEAVDPKVEAAAAETSQPSFSRGKSLMVGILALVALVVCTVLFLYPGLLRHGRGASASQETPSLSLRVERTGTDILLTWNRDSAAIQHATHAVLTISDGERHENYDMDLGQLRNGSIVYSPLTADVSFHMEVTGQGNAKSASESVRVLRTRPSPMPDGSDAPPDAAAKTNAKPATPAGSAAAMAPAEDPSAEQAPAPAKAVTPSKPFNTESLAQRLRPATQSDIALPEAPALGTSVTPSAVPTIGGAPVAPAPFVPAAPAPERRASSAPAASASTGGQITQAQVLHSKQPEYPKLARQMGIKGNVEVLATIGTDGRVKSVKVEKGHPLLVKAAVDAVMQWTYRPTLLNGVPVQNDTHITLNFMGDR
jgi:protein TonB